MDTLSRDSSSSSSSIVPMAGLFAAVLALILAIVALVKLSTLQKTVVAHGDEIAKIATLENEVRSVSASAAKTSDVTALRDGFQNALNQVGEQLGLIRAQLTKLEEAAKKPAAAAAKGGAAVATGTVDASGHYTVAPGDTLSKIARKFAVKIDAIEAENPGLSTSLKVGQKIKIPKK